MDKPYHHIYKDGGLFAFRNPEGGPQRYLILSGNGKFLEEKRNLVNYPPEHVIDKQIF